MIECHFEMNVSGYDETTIVYNFCKLPAVPRVGDSFAHRVIHSVEFFPNIPHVHIYCESMNDVEDLWRTVAELADYGWGQPKPE